MSRKNTRKPHNNSASLITKINNTSWFEDTAAHSLAHTHTTHSLSLFAIEQMMRQSQTDRLFGSSRSAKRNRNRLVDKYAGACNLRLVNIPKHHRQYCADIFSTAIEFRWRWCLIGFALAFIMTLTSFSVVYYLLMVLHGDFDHPNRDNEWKPCVANVNNRIVNVFLFAFETQSTIGYGYR